jgi:hypothetical protein
MNQKSPNVSAVEAPPEPPALAYATVKVVALVTVQQNDAGQEEISTQPPHLAAAVVVKDQPGAIVAFCGPASELGCVQDAVVLSQAYALRTALRNLLTAVKPYADAAACTAAQAALDLAEPQYAQVSKPSAEDQLAAAREAYDPSQNPGTAEILEPATTH